MPIGGGGSGGGGASAWLLLSNTTLGADGTFDVQNIDQTYNDLVLMAIFRGTRAATVDFLQVRFNNDSGANYDGIWSTGGGTATSLGATSGRISGAMVAASGTAGDFFMAEMFIGGYASTTWRKTIFSTAAAPVTAGVTIIPETATVWWNSTAAINRIGFFGGTTANLLAGSQLRIYGRK